MHAQLVLDNYLAIDGEVYELLIPIVTKKFLRLNQLMFQKDKMLKQLKVGSHLLKQVLSVANEFVATKLIIRLLISLNQIKMAALEVKNHALDLLE